MKAEDQYLKFVRWNEEDSLYVGYCPDLFPWGGICHGADEAETYRQLGELVREEIAQLQAEGKQLPPVTTRRDARSGRRVTPPPHGCPTFSPQQSAVL